MKRTIFGAVVGAIVVFAGTTLYDQWRISSIQSQPAENWLHIDLDIPDVAGGQVPMVVATYQVLRPVIIRTNISPRNLETGTPLCQGRITSTYDAASDIQKLNVPVSVLAGLDSCVWPVGRYSASITFTMTDLETNIQLKSLAMEREFSVSP